MGWTKAIIIALMAGAATWLAASVTIEPMANNYAECGTVFLCSAQH